tara:strand:+ start:119 stop:310 length:192 start_codon:yes stop_codon:yes gene_type:complete
MKVNCAGCGGHLGDASGANAKVKARFVDIANGRIRIKCPKCHAYTAIPGLEAAQKRRVVAIRK